MSAIRLWLALTLMYVATVICVRLLALGSIVLDAPAVTSMLVVPAVQAIVVTAVRRWRRV